MGERGNGTEVTPHKRIPKEEYLLLEFSDDHREVELWSRCRLPFEPKGAIRDLRNALTRAIRALPPVPPGSVLHATSASPINDRCDAENILFYNVGPGAFVAVAKNGVRFERGYVVPPPPASLAVALHHHRYRFDSSADGFTSWRRRETMASWGPVRVNPTASVAKAGWLWRAVKRTITQIRPCALEAPFGVSVSVSGAGRLVNATSLLKPIFDGVVAAFQCQTESSDLPEVCHRIGFQLGMEPQEVRALLTNAEQGVLGTHRIVCLRAGGVQWSPADDRCVAGELLVDSSGDGGGCGLSGTLFAVASVHRSDDVGAHP